MCDGAPGRSMVAMPDRRRRPTLAVCCLAQFMCMLDVALVNVALPPIRAELGFSAGGLQWVVNAYALAAAGCLLLGGRAADLLGRREVLVAGLCAFGLGSLAAGLAQDPAMLVAARAAQGVGGAVVAPTSLSILAVTFAEGPERNRALGLWGTLGALGGVTGALLGGVVTAALSWRWTLLMNAAVASGLAALALRAIPRLRRPGAARSFDVGGALAVTAGMVLLTYGISGTRAHGWGTAATLAPIAAGAALLGLFALIEARLAGAPLVPARVVRSPALAAAAATIFCLGATVAPMWFFVSLYVHGELGYSALQTGLTLAPMSLVIAICTHVASRLAARCGPGRVLAAGMTTLAAGMFLLARGAAGGSLGGGRARPLAAVRGRHRLLVRLHDDRGDDGRGARGLRAGLRHREHGVPARWSGRARRPRDHRRPRTRLRGRRRVRARRCGAPWFWRIR